MMILTPHFFVIFLLLAVTVGTMKTIKPAKAMCESASSNRRVPYFAEPIHIRTDHGSVCTMPLTGIASAYSILCNTPAMPLNDAHFGGFFASGGCQ